MVKNLLTHVKRVLPFIGIAILIYILYSLNVQKIIDALFSIDPIYIVYALLLTIPLLLIRNIAWQLVLRAQHIHLGFLPSLKIYLIGIFYGSITPGYVGQVMRVAYLKEKTKEPFGKLFVNTVIETFVHTFSLYGMMIIGALLVLGTIPQLLPITIVWIVGVSLVALYFVNKQRGEKLFRFLITHLIPKNAKQYLTAFVDSFYNDFPGFVAMILPYVLGIITWVIVFSQEYCIVIALGLQIPYLAFLLLFPIANTAGFIPITFAGLGTRELTAIFIFSTLFQTPGEQIVILSLVGFVVTDLFLGFLGFLLSLTESRPLTKMPENMAVSF
jgi:uncharacterized protein (TIRG00374 family)